MAYTGFKQASKLSREAALITPNDIGAGVNVTIQNLSDYSIRLYGMVGVAVPSGSEPHITLGPKTIVAQESVNKIFGKTGITRIRAHSEGTQSAKVYVSYA